jgi:hypothetical protein
MLFKEPGNPILIDLRKWNMGSQQSKTKTKNDNYNKDLDRAKIQCEDIEKLFRKAVLLDMNQIEGSMRYGYYDRSFFQKAWSMIYSEFIATTTAEGYVLHVTSCHSHGWDTLDIDSIPTSSSVKIIWKRLETKLPNYEAVDVKASLNEGIEQESIGAN